eukprot:CAMPEP_0171125484 /NCGR_PEP_ID=MMETSP0766_2-20121228/111346_1 /TAXON_ID=439317 /ORGANISM="Gambierdiscus australes, Strain CAWD 149" /LENGTH=136 /DNA_ID=CAMNT_0011588471 /DNA_START=16 /DNA_END=422 /DNA_ORIENTATION=+
MCDFHSPSRLHRHRDFVREWARHMTGDLNWLRSLVPPRDQDGGKPLFKDDKPRKGNDSMSSLDISTTEFDEMEALLTEMKGCLLQVRNTFDSTDVRSPSNCHRATSVAPGSVSPPGNGRSREDRSSRAEQRRQTPP